MQTERWKKFFGGISCAMFIPLNIIQFHKYYILTALTLIGTSVPGTYLLATMNQSLSEDEAAVKSEVVLII